MDQPGIQQKKKMIHTVTLAKGIAIIFVVIGHYFPESSPACWIRVNDFIYLFHMPLFFILSGFLLQFSSVKEYKKFPVFVLKKTKRLIIPFFTIAVIFLCVKSIAGIFVPLENPVTLTSVLQLFINPVDSFVPLLWFIYTLFFIQLLFQGIRLLLKNPTVLFIISLLIMFIPVPGHIFVFYITLNLSFFVTGYILSGYFMVKNKNPDTISISIVIIATLICLGCTLFLLWIKKYTGNNIFLDRIITFALGTSLSFFCIGCSSLLARIRHLMLVKALIVTGSSSMGIYLLHTLFESFVRIIFRHFLFHLPFIIPAILAILSGIIFPILVEHFILRRFTLTRRLLLGIK